MIMVETFLDTCMRVKSMWSILKNLKLLAKAAIESVAFLAKY